ncbi:hypothetical protein KCP69_23120 [Salmonella enterica subsp. enterica]|nr:hypothetical protein KCP69_23120 [Salmonella enterica subsp. enterica]
MINIAARHWGRRNRRKYLQLPERSGSGGGGDKRRLKGQVAVAFVIPKQSDTLADREAACDEEKRLWRWWTTRSVTLVVRRMSGLFRSSPKTRSERCFAARSVRSVKAAIRDLTTIDDPRVVAANSPRRGIAVSRISRVRQRVRPGSDRIVGVTSGKGRQRAAR